MTSCVYFSPALSDMMSNPHRTLSVHHNFDRAGLKPLCSEPGNVQLAPGKMAICAFETNHRACPVSRMHERQILRTAVVETSGYHETVMLLRYRGFKGVHTTAMSTTLVIGDFAASERPLFILEASAEVSPDEALTQLNDRFDAHLASRIGKDSSTIDEQIVEVDESVPVNSDTNEQAVPAPFFEEVLTR